MSRIPLEPAVERRFELRGYRFMIHAYDPNSQATIVYVQGRRNSLGMGEGQGSHVLMRGRVHIGICVRMDDFLCASIAHAHARVCLFQAMLQ